MQHSSRHGRHCDAIIPTAEEKSTGRGHFGNVSSLACQGRVVLRALASALMTSGPGDRVALQAPAGSEGRHGAAQHPWNFKRNGYD